MTLKPTENSTDKPATQQTQQPGASNQVGAKRNNEASKSHGSDDHKVTDQEAKTGKGKPSPCGSLQHK